MKTGDVECSKACECHAKLPINQVLRSLEKFLPAELHLKFTKVHKKSETYPWWSYRCYINIF